MQSVKDREVWKFALEQAAEEAFKSEVVETEMVNLIIGPGKEFADKNVWMEDKIMGWIGAVQDKFDALKLPKMELDEDVIKMAYAFYNLKLGDSNQINKDTRIVRVPGGWMWQSMNDPHRSSFIPYSKEFLFAINRNDSDAL